jgi:hypothetical protein
LREGAKTLVRLIVQLSPWLLPYLLLLPIAIWWYGVRARRLSRRFRSWVSRSKLRLLVSLRRRLLSLLTEPPASEPDDVEEARRIPIRPRS